MSFRDRSGGFAATIVWTFILYAVLTAAAALLTRFNHGIALIWLANGPLLATLCRTPPRRWLPIAIAAWLGMVCAVFTAIGIRLVAMPVALVDVGEAVVAAALLRHWRVSDTLFRSVRTIPAFVAACAVATLLSGLPGAVLAAETLHLAVLQVWSDWIIGHGCGLLLGTPLALVVRRDEGAWAELARPGRGGAAAGAALLVAATTFGAFWQSTLPLLFLPFLPVMIAAVAFERVGAAVSVVIVATIGGLLTIAGHGPVMLMHGDAALRLQVFHFYLVVMFLTALPIAALLVQRETLVRALAENEARYRLLADNATDIMLTFDPDGTVRFVSPAVREIALYEPEALLGTSITDLIYPEDRARVRAIYAAGLATPERSHAFEFRAIKADGTVSWFEGNSRIVVDANGAPDAIVCILRDLEGRKQREAELERAAASDPLTGLLNRTAFRRRVDERLRGDDPPGALALVDLDYFKLVNDVHGHATGDTALLVLADLLRTNLRAEDAVGRIGGEEFAILFAGRDTAAAVAICDRLRDLLARTLIPAPHDCFSITMSAGVMPLRRDLSVDALFSRADEALYRAKALGRNRTERAVGAG
ncbi:diguanylate cyclase [Sphingomonas sp. H39-1-10]|uniref:sensor domain-containing diguanylate cyclase n=1 Tax=Sphingomonas pollutisoli TaxID=3030829 RepID=UPI0023B906F7|nr:diguanylate cyclase [Sphingomonas pollutisoli]MDF0488291.1 diguanylate cyclase [Sphingomonas pollutisoli]